MKSGVRKVKVLMYKYLGFTYPTREQHIVNIFIPTY